MALRYKKTQTDRFISPRALFFLLLTITLSFGAIAAAQTINFANAQQDNVQNDNAQQEQMQGSVPEEAPPTGDVYKGVIPGKNDLVEHTRVPKIHTTASKELTWIGFQKEDDKDRVFFQFDTIPYYTVKEDGNKLFITFEDTAPTAKNFVRELDTSAFNSRIKKIDSSLNKRKNTTSIVITYDGNPNYVASTENGYLFIDFPK